MERELEAAQKLEELKTQGLDELHEESSINDDLLATLNKLTREPGDRPKMQLPGGNEWNGLELVVAVKRALRTHGYIPQEVEQFRAEALSGNHEHLLRVIEKWVNVSWT